MGFFSRKKKLHEIEDRFETEAIAEDFSESAAKKNNDGSAAVHPADTENTDNTAEADFLTGLTVRLMPASLMELVPVSTWAHCGCP
ncbi:hypothetical protein RQN30_00495 [Arcanobacterium hippocoleae]